MNLQLSYAYETVSINHVLDLTLCHPQAKKLALQTSSKKTSLKVQKKQTDTRSDFLLNEYKDLGNYDDFDDLDDFM